MFSTFILTGIELSLVSATSPHIRPNTRGHTVRSVCATSISRCGELVSSLCLGALNIPPFMLTMLLSELLPASMPSTPVTVIKSSPATQYQLIACVGTSPSSRCVERLLTEWRLIRQPCSVTTTSSLSIAKCSTYGGASSPVRRCYMLSCDIQPWPLSCSLVWVSDHPRRSRPMR